MNIEEFYKTALAAVANMPPGFLSPVQPMLALHGQPMAPLVDTAALNFYDPSHVAAYVTATTGWVAMPGSVGSSRK